MLYRIFKKMSIAKVDVKSKNELQRQSSNRFIKNSLSNKSDLNHQVNENFISEILNQKSNQKSRYSIRYFRQKFSFFDRIRIIYLLREFFRILFTLSAISSFFFICSITSIFNQKISKLTQISSQKVHIFRFNTSSIRQHRNYSFCLKIRSKTYLSIYRFSVIFLFRW